MVNSCKLNHLNMIMPSNSVNQKANIIKYSLLRYKLDNWTKLLQESFLCFSTKPRFILTIINDKKIICNFLIIVIWSTICPHLSSKLCTYDSLTVMTRHSNHVLQHVTLICINCIVYLLRCSDALFLDAWMIRLHSSPRSMISMMRTNLDNSYCTLRTWTWCLRIFITIKAIKAAMRILLIALFFFDIFLYLAYYNKKKIS